MKEGKGWRKGEREKERKGEKGEKENKNLKVGNKGKSQLQVKRNFREDILQTHVSSQNVLSL